MNFIIINEYILIFISAFIVFSKSLNNHFIFDDHEAIVNNDDLQNLDSNLSSYLNVFKNDFWGEKIIKNSSHKSYRPFTIIVYRLIAKFFASTYDENKSKIVFDPYPFHFVKLLIYCYCCCYVFYTLRNWFKSSLISVKNFNRLAFEVTLFFTIHPLHCEPVSTCVGLADILSALFSLFALNCFISNTYLFELNTPSLKWIAIQLKIIIFSFASMLFKEQGITILGFLLILIVQIWLKNHETKRWGLLIVTAIIYLSTIFAFVHLRLWIMNYQLPQFGPMDNPASHLTSWRYRVINYSYLYLLNALITICPIWLSFDWSMGCIAVIQTIKDYRFTYVIIFWITIAISALKIVVSFRHLIPFILFSLITFLPASNIFFPVGFVIAERNLFLPILGYCIVFVFLLNHLSEQLSSKILCKLLHNSFHILLIILAIRSYQRSSDWNNELRLYESDSNICPNNAKIYYNIGKISSEAGNRTKAIKNYRKSIELYENYTNALNNLANILKEERNGLIESKKLLERACRVDPKFATGWMNLATVETAFNNFDKSESYFFRALKIRPNHANTHFNLGNLYIKQKKFKEAENSLYRAIELNRKFAKAWHNLILLKQNEKSYDMAYELALAALKELPNDHSLNFLMGNICAQFLRKFTNAEHYYLEAIRLQPHNPSYTNNLAVLYHRTGNNEDAIKYYRQTLLLDPHHVNTKNNLKKLLNKI